MFKASALQPGSPSTPLGSVHSFRSPSWCLSSSLNFLAFASVMHRLGSDDTDVSNTSYFMYLCLLKYYGLKIIKLYISCV